MVTNPVKKKSVKRLIFRWVLSFEDVLRCVVLMIFVEIVCDSGILYNFPLHGKKKHY